MARLYKLILYSFWVFFFVSLAFCIASLRIRIAVLLFCMIPHMKGVHFEIPDLSNERGPGVKIC